MWNSLPQHLQATSSFNVFKNQINVWSEETHVFLFCSDCWLCFESVLFSVHFLDVILNVLSSLHFNLNICIAISNMHKLFIFYRSS